MTRRRLVGFLAIALLARIGPAAADADPLNQAAAFVRQAGNQFAVLAAAARGSEDGRRRLSAFIDEAVDVDAVARFCLGRFWRLATPEQQREYTGLFRQVLLNAVAGRLCDDPEGAASVVIAQPVQTPAGIDVPTVVQRSNVAPAHVTWTVSMASGRPKIIDVTAEGVSLRLTQRSDYQAFLNRNNQGIEALLSALRRQASGE
jgi:phospholipid transport system substrate-binding protein